MSDVTVPKLHDVQQTSVGLRLRWRTAHPEPVAMSGRPGFQTKAANDLQHRDEYDYEWEDVAASKEAADAFMARWNGRDPTKSWTTADVDEVFREVGITVYDRNI